jgi:hypothetical protein
MGAGPQRQLHFFVCHLSLSAYPVSITRLLNQPGEGHVFFYLLTLRCNAYNTPYPQIGCACQLISSTPERSLSRFDFALQPWISVRGNFAGTPHLLSDEA